MLIALHDGEEAIQHAPLIKLKSGEDCIPQHYLRYEHTLESVQKIALNCYFDNNHLIFVGQEKGGIYIQIGIVGYDNYKDVLQQTQKKIVYGRKWRVEAELPTSEIIQTIFLAIKKAREHEVRELFKLSFSKYTTTPFSNHHDSLLMSKNAKLLEVREDEVTLKEFTRKVLTLLPRVKYDQRNIDLLGVEKRKNGDLLIDLVFSSVITSQQSETNNNTFTILLNKINVNNFLYKLMEKFVQNSDREVEENFTYVGFKRFSYNNSIEEIAELSIDTRSKRHIRSKAFLSALEKTNYETDKNRVPLVLKNELGERIAKTLSTFGNLDGILPIL